METERAPGTRELMTRGPEGSAVRSNIAGMVQDVAPPAGARGSRTPGGGAWGGAWNLTCDELGPKRASGRHLERHV